MTDHADVFFHTNDSYEVILNPEGDGYQLRNNSSKVIEFESQQLPECIFAAENLAAILRHRTWEYIAQQAQEESASKAGLAAVSDLRPVT